ncbi:MAG: biotin transporter BioY [Spirochaetales bacterium]|nr:biotin transporter BioY [Spirochaetales bacterium]
MTKRIVFTALFAALTAVCGFISIPVPGTPIPIVIQNMMVVLDGLLLGPVWGFCAVAVFILSGLIGLPVFSGGTAGIAKLMSPTGGFIIGYAFAALLAGLIAKRPSAGGKRNIVRLSVAALCGFVIMYVPGVIHFMRSLNKTFSETMALCVIPYIPGDVIKTVASILICIPLRKTVAAFVFQEEITRQEAAKEGDGK